MSKKLSLIFGSIMLGFAFASSAQAMTVDEEVSAKVTELTQSAVSDSEKVYKIYTWITSNIAYDLDFYSGSLYSESNTYQGAWKNHEANCSGFADLLHVMLDKALVKNAITTGTAEGFPGEGYTAHVWNQVWINGSEYYLDATWDAGDISKNKKKFTQDPDKAYYLKNLKCMRYLGHADTPSYELNSALREDYVRENLVSLLDCDDEIPELQDIAFSEVTGVAYDILVEQKYLTSAELREFLSKSSLKEVEPVENFAPYFERGEWITWNQKLNESILQAGESTLANLRNVIVGDKVYYEIDAKNSRMATFAVVSRVTYEQMVAASKGTNTFVSKLVKRGVLASSADLKMEKTLNRAELLKILFRLTGKTVSKQKDCFPDVGHKNWYSGYVCTAAAEGLIGGYKDGKFHPEYSVNMAEALKTTYKFFGKSGVKTSSKYWYAPYYLSARAKQILPNTNTAPETVLDRSAFLTFLEKFYARYEISL